ncbi:MAG: glycosyltransferase [Chloroflexi bacterium]|nr:glycosyltransferase [Chloroflexota bacterium]
MKILVLTEALALDRTSEGICSSKFVLALRRMRHDVVCLSSEPQFSTRSGRFFVPWLPDIPIFYAYQYAIQKLTLSENTSRNALRIKQKYHAAWAYVTGWNPDEWNQIKSWNYAINLLIDQEKPDLVFVRGAGQGFFPHMAMTKIHKKVPWIANYHDPFPLSHYPEPYRRVRRLLSWRQEVQNEKILSEASRISFPSQRLLNWMLQGKLQKYRFKATVIPHLAMDLPSSEDSENVPEELILNPDHFNLVHTGTLLGPRQPWALFQAFQKIIEIDPEFSHKAHIYLIGKVNSHHKTDMRWQNILSMPQVKIFEGRLSYHQSLTLAKTSSALILLEAASVESPFFPAKLADYLWTGKPIIALSPVLSTTADLLGKNYLLLANPDDVDDIKAKIYQLWLAWKQGDISKFNPLSSTVKLLTEAAVAIDINNLLNSLPNL